MGRIRAVIFDLDGTLTDSAPEIAQALNAVWADLGRPAVPLGTVAGYIGDGPGKLIERARAALGLAAETAAIDRETDAFLAAYAAAGPGGEAYPGALEVVRRLAEAGFRLGVCTNKPQAAAERLLDTLGFARWLDGVVGGDTAPRRKPDPAHVLAALDRLDGIAPGEAMLVGDGPQDVDAGEAAGLAVVVAAYGYGGAAALRPDLPAIAAIDALPAMLGLNSAIQPARAAGESGRNIPN